MAVRLSFSTFTAITVITGNRRLSHENFMNMTLVERFLKYVSFDTQSNEQSGVTPSSPGQMAFAKYLKEELEALGLEETTLDENGYLFATLPANTDKPLPVVGFIAHMDTSPDMSGKDVSRVSWRITTAKILYSVQSRISFSLRRNSPNCSAIREKT